MAWDNKVPVGFRLQAIDRLVLIYNKFEINLGPLTGFVVNIRCTIASPTSHYDSIGCISEFPYAHLTRFAPNVDFLFISERRLLTNPVNGPKLISNLLYIKTRRSIACSRNPTGTVLSQAILLSALTSHRPSFVRTFFPVSESVIQVLFAVIRCNNLRHLTNTKSTAVSPGVTPRSPKDGSGKFHHKHLLCVTLPR